METVRARTPADLAVLVPYLLGFHPERSFVMLGLRGRRLELTQRMDVVPPAHAPEVVRQMVEHAVRAGATRAVVLAYEDEEGQSAPMRAALAELVAASVIRCDVTVVVRDGRWYDMGSSGRRSRLGEPLPEPSEVPAVASFVAQGRRPLPSREALRHRVEAGADEVAERVRELLAGPDVPVPDLEGRAAALRAVLHPRSPGPLTDEEAVAALVLGLRDVLWRDALLAALCPGWVPDDLVGAGRVAGVRAAVGELDPPTAVERVLGLVRAVPADESAPALTVLGQVAWSAGEGALATIALEQALEVDPGYGLAQLLDRLVSLGMRPPSTAA